jgi:hypothetical protein
MSLEPYYYRPATPPNEVVDQLIGSAHSRNTSGSSIYSNNSSPDSILTQLTTPNRSPIRQHGPALLPKIRTQDQGLEPAGPKRHRRVLSNTRNPPGFMPYAVRPPMQRSVTEPAECTLLSPLSTNSNSVFGSRASSELNSPITFTSSHSRKPSGSHSRSGSTSSIDNAALSRFGYPTYRQLPTYISQSQVIPTTVAFAPAVAAPTLDVYTYIPYQPQPTIPVESYPLPLDQQYMEDQISTSNLLDYLTGSNQAVNLVHQLRYNTSARGTTPYFWWDIRNLRSWDDFNLSTIASIPGLMELLRTPLPSTATPSAVVSTSRLSPDSETALLDLVNSIYAPKVNAALKVSQGASSMKLYPCPISATASRSCEPSFLANYPLDFERTINGTPRGRVVGLVKSFDSWNTGMRNEPNHKKVEYLRGLSHLQRCMREHSCRYGFILTEIELVCVRAGCDEGSDIPYFGFLEIANPIETKASSSNMAADGEIPMTVNLALWYLLMLGKYQPLENQPGCHLDVGGPGALTRQRFLPEGKDPWIPEPHNGEKREAKRVRGWVFPSEPWNKREGGAGRQGNRKTWNK